MLITLLLSCVAQPIGFVELTATCESVDVLTTSRLATGGIYVTDGTHSEWHPLRPSDPVDGYAVLSAHPTLESTFDPADPYGWQSSFSCDDWGFPFLPSYNSSALTYAVVLFDGLAVADCLIMGFDPEGVLKARYDTGPLKFTNPKSAGCEVFPWP